MPKFCKPSQRPSSHLPSSSYGCNLDPSLRLSQIVQLLKPDAGSWIFTERAHLPRRSSCHCRCSSEKGCACRIVAMSRQLGRMPAATSLTNCTDQQAASPGLQHGTVSARARPSMGNTWHATAWMFKRDCPCASESDFVQNLRHLYGSGRSQWRFCAQGIVLCPPITWSALKPGSSAGKSSKNKPPMPRHSLRAGM